MVRVYRSHSSRKNRRRNFPAAANHATETPASVSSLSSLPEPQPLPPSHDSFGPARSPMASDASSVASAAHSTGTSCASANDNDTCSDALSTVTVVSDSPVGEAASAISADTAHAMTHGTSTSSVPRSPSRDPLSVWVNSAGALMRSPEMADFIASSQYLAQSTGGAIVQTACLPVTFPMQVMLRTSQGIAGLTTHAMEQIARHNPLTSQQYNGGESTSSTSPMENMWNSIVPTLVHTAENIQHEIGSSAFNIIAPLFGIHRSSRPASISSSQSSSTFVSAKSRQSTKGNPSTSISDRNRDDDQYEPRPREPAGQSSSEHINFLDRLRLDLPVVGGSRRRGNEHSEQEDDDDDLDGYISPPTPQPWDNSSYLLRVDDIDLNHPKYTSRPLYCVDVHSDYSSEYITRYALDALVQRSLSIVTTNPYTQLRGEKPRDALPSSGNDDLISWTPEPSGVIFEQEFHTMEQDDIYSKLEHEYAVWSGMYHGSAKFHKADTPLYIARGVVPISPRDFFDLMWDSSRSEEYNHYSLGRSDIAILTEDGRFHDLSCSDAVVTKIIQSETKVPLTGLSVQLCALMHAQHLPSEDGYIIITRSLHPGAAGCHSNISMSRIQSTSKNEVVLGINIMRQIPGRPQCTDLVSVSQVASGYVPQFLAKQIGMAGLDDFVKNLRAIGDRMYQ